MSHALRITFVMAHAGMSGGVRVIASIAGQLRRRGHRVVVVSTPLPAPTWRSRLKRLAGRDPTPRPEARQPYFDFDVDHRVLDRARHVEASDVPDADVIVATWWETAEWVAPMPAAKGEKIYFIQQFEADLNPAIPGDRVEATWTLPMRKIVCAQWLADLARDRYGDAEAVVVPNGVSRDLFHAPPRGKQPRPTVGLLYSTHPVKRCDLALEAIALAKRELRDLSVVAFGAEDPSRRVPLPRYASYTKLPRQTRLRELYAQCDVWLCASRSEGFHLPPHEAMACRCPVVSTLVGGPMDMIVDGVSGYLVNQGDARLLAERLVRVLTVDEDGWRAMSDAALETALRYSWEDAASRFEAVFHQSIERRLSMAGASSDSAAGGRRIGA